MAMTSYYVLHRLDKYFLRLGFVKSRVGMRSGGPNRHEAVLY